VARNTVGSRPRTDSPIPLVTDPVTGFFVAIDCGDPELAVQLGEDVGQSPGFQNQTIAELLQAEIETGERLVEKFKMDGVKIGSLQHFRFVDEQAQAGSAGGSGGQRSVIGGTQVTAEPDDLQCHGGLSQAWGREKQEI
jgi:hypothetical protein